MKKRNVKLILLVLLLVLSLATTLAQEPTAEAATTTVDTVQAGAVDATTAWVVIVAVAGIAAVAYLFKTSAALLADSVPREFATFILAGGDALVDVAGNLADKFDEYAKQTDTQLDDQALDLMKGFIASLQKKE